MTPLWRELLSFIASCLLGALFLDVFLTIYERRRKAVPSTTARIFRWSIRGGIGIGVLTAILRLLA